MHVHVCTRQMLYLNISVHICFKLATECVCARTYMRAHTHSVASVKICTYMRAHTHSVASVQMCTLIFITPVSYTPVHAWCSPMNACLLSARMHMDTCMRAYATVQKRLCRGHGCFCTYMRAHTLHIHVRTYTFCTSAKQMCTLMFTTPVSYTPANACCSTRPMNACLLSARMHMDSCMRAYATVQKRLCRDHGSYCKLILNLARASCRLSFAACPPAGLTLFAQEIRLNPR